MSRLKPPDVSDCNRLLQQLGHPHGSGESLRTVSRKFLEYSEAKRLSGFQAESNFSYQ
jgi:hypothetical protein